MEEIENEVVVKVEKIAQKLGVLLDPPSLVLIYQERINQKSKLKKRIIPVRNLFSFGLPIKYITSDIQADFFHDVKGPVYSQIEKMVRILQEHLKGQTLNAALDVVDKEFEDYNKLSAPDLQRKKEIMDKLFQNNLIHPNDPNYVYDKRVEFNNNEKHLHEWDTEDEIEDMPEDEVSTPTNDTDNF